MENFSKYKILILGYLSSSSIDIYINAAKLYGVSNTALEFITDPNNFKMSMIRNSFYTDLFLSCTPHNLEGVHEKNLIRQVRKHPELYPRLHTTAQTEINFKPLSLNQFEIFLKNSKYFEVLGLTGVKLEKENNQQPKPITVVSNTVVHKKPRNGTTYKNFLKKLTEKYS